MNLNNRHLANAALSIGIRILAVVFYDFSYTDTDEPEQFFLMEEQINLERNHFREKTNFRKPKKQLPTKPRNGTNPVLISIKKLLSN